ncbi:hypothetical protein OIO90_000434 [Microbotryomycetes sp. JL221]|nr:hypothetical protein OIO90_000434 [Microbotryomycetes sp. JL221]
MARYQPPSSRFMSPAAGSTSVHAAAVISRDSASTTTRADPKVRCSNCGLWLDMVSLEQHDCHQHRSTQQQRAKGTHRPPPPLRLDIDKAIAIGHQQQAERNAITAPHSQAPQHSTHLASSDWTRKDTADKVILSPHLLSATLSNTDSRSLSHSSSATSLSSATSSSSSSCSKLPFFERYQRLMASPQTQPQDLPALHRTTAHDSSIARSATPVKQASPSVHPSHNPHEFDNYDYDNNFNFGQPSPQMSTTSDGSSSRWRQRFNNESPASSIMSQSPSNSPLFNPSKRSFMDLNGKNLLTNHFNNDHRRDTIKASHSTPANLSSFAASNNDTNNTTNVAPLSLWETSPVRRSQWSASDRSTTCSSAFGLTSSLEACLEDLRLMTEHDNEQDTSAVLDDLLNFENDNNLPRHHHQQPQQQQNMTSPLPLPLRRPQVPHSHSSPSLPTTARMIPQSECTTCHKICTKPQDVRNNGDGVPFCRTCYAERFLPKCRKCKQPIEGSAVTSSDGKISGKYHPQCFGCFECNVSFDNDEFYVFERKPCCQRCWHKANNSMCVGCQQPIEGPCVSLVGEDGGRYHPEHFICSMTNCHVSLPEFHFLIGSLPFCEQHAFGFNETTLQYQQQQQQMLLNSQLNLGDHNKQQHEQFYSSNERQYQYQNLQYAFKSGSTRATKRKTIITLR